MQGVLDVGDYGVDANGDDDTEGYGPPGGSLWFWLGGTVWKGSIQMCLSSCKNIRIMSEWFPKQNGKL